MIALLKTMYRRYLRFPALDRALSSLLDYATDCYSAALRYSFPRNYIRRWKLDMLFGLYEKETHSLFKKIIRPGMVAVDIGAHIGYFTRAFSKLTGPRGAVYAFEADPENFALLQKNTRHLKNVRPYQLAVTDQTGTIDFYHYDEKAGCHSILANVPLDFKKRKITVPAVSLDAFLQQSGIPRVDLIKMDIEGGEPSALRGMDGVLRSPHLSLVVEFAPAWIKAAGVEPLQILKQLESYGFTLFAIKETLRPISTESKEGYQSHLPQTPDHYNEFINLFCVKKQAGSL